MASLDIIEPAETLPNLPCRPVDRFLLIGSDERADSADGASQTGQELLARLVTCCRLEIGDL